MKRHQSLRWLVLFLWKEGGLLYPVSEAFLQAVQENTRRYYWTGIITTTKGAVYKFGADDIVKGSGYISSQCCGSTEIELGTVYAAEMGITLLSDIDRYTLEDVQVELFYHLKLPDASYEEVPMGIFEVSEANRNIEIHQPEETWHSGKHSIMMYYPIENLVANYRNIFNVYARATGGTVMVGTGD